MSAFFCTVLCNARWNHYTILRNDSTSHSDVERHTEHSKHISDKVASPRSLCVCMVCVGEEQRENRAQLPQIRGSAYGKDRITDCLHVGLQTELCRSNRGCTVNLKQNVCILYYIPSIHNISVQ